MTDTTPALSRIQSRRQDRIVVARAYQERLDRAIEHHQAAPPPVPAATAVACCLGTPAVGLLVLYVCTSILEAPAVPALVTALAVTAVIAIGFAPWDKSAAAERAETLARQETRAAHPKEHAIWAETNATDIFLIPTKELS